MALTGSDGQLGAVVTDEAGAAGVAGAAGADAAAPAILLVEDDPDQRVELADILVTSGFRCLAVVDGMAALDALGNGSQFDVVLCDVFLPRLGGLALARELARRLAAWPWLRLILLSGRSAPDLLREALQTNAVEFLSKPIGAAALLAAVHRAAAIAANLRREVDGGAGGGARPALPRLRPAPPRSSRAIAATPSGAPGSLGRDFPAELAARLRRCMRFERARAELFGRDMVAAPAWDMLLDLLNAQLRGERVSVSSLCVASGGPPTTALRRIADLQAAGLLTRTPDPKDRRRVYVDLTELGQARLDAFLSRFGVDEFAPSRSGGAA
jgi:CheY-like chemotaxis protein